MVRLVLFSFLAFIGFHLSATHNWGGYITVEKNSGNTYHIEVVQFQDHTSPGFRDTVFLEVNYGGNPMDTIAIPGAQAFDVGGDIVKTIYPHDYTFPGPGKYNLSLTDPNLQANILNIENSVDVPMYVETEVYVGPGFTQTATYDSASRTIYNKGDTFFYHFHTKVDDQQVQFERVVPLEADGVEVPGYLDMDAQVDSRSGLFYFPLGNAVSEGMYYFAVEASTYKNGQLTSRMQRTILAEIYDQPMESALQPVSGFPQDTFANSYNVYIEPGTADTFEVKWQDNIDTNSQDVIAFSSDLDVQEEIITQNDSIHHSRFIVSVEPGQQRINPYFVTIRGKASFATPSGTSLQQTQDMALVITTDQSSGIPPNTVEPLTIYPNPAQETLVINASGEIEMQRYEIYEMDGRLVQSGYVSSSGRIKLHSLGSGIYILKAVDRSGQWSQGRFVKE